MPKRDIAKFVQRVGTALEEMTGASSHLRRVIVIMAPDGIVSGTYVNRGPTRVHGRLLPCRAGSMIVGWNTALAWSRLARGEILSIPPGHEDIPLTQLVPHGNVVDTYERFETLVHELLHSLGSANRRVYRNQLKVTCAAHGWGNKVLDEGITAATTALLIPNLMKKLDFVRVDPRLVDLHGADLPITYPGFESAVRRITGAVAGVRGTSMGEELCRFVADGAGDVAKQNLVRRYLVGCRVQPTAPGVAETVAEIERELAPEALRFSLMLNLRSAEERFGQLPELRLRGGQAGRRAVAILNRAVEATPEVI